MADPVNDARKIALENHNKKAMIWACLTATISLVPLITLIYFLATNLSQGNQFAYIVWLFIFVFLRLTLPLAPGANDVFFVFQLGCSVMGFIMFVIAGGSLKNVTMPPNADSAIPFLMFVTYGFDVMNFIIFWSYYVLRGADIDRKYPKREEAKEERAENVVIEMVAVPVQPIEPVNKPGVHTHLFYTECVICTDKLGETDIVKDLPCKHVFHPKCIDGWMAEHNDCPVCKSKV